MSSMDSWNFIKIYLLVLNQTVFRPLWAKILVCEHQWVWAKSYDALSMFNTTGAEAVVLWVETFFPLSWLGGAVLSRMLEVPGDHVWMLTPAQPTALALEILQFCPIWNWHRCCYPMCHTWSEPDILQRRQLWDGVELTVNHGSALCLLWALGKLITTWASFLSTSW